MSRTFSGVFMGLLLLLSACTANPTPTLVPTPKSTPIAPPAVEAALEQLFWVAADIAGVKAGTPFEEAKTRLGFRLFESLDKKVMQLEQLGINYYVDWPYCFYPTVGAAAILSLGKSKTPAEAAPHANRAIESIAAMDVDIQLAREQRTGALSREDSLRLCTRVIQEVTKGNR